MADFELMPNSEVWVRTPTAASALGLRSRRAEGPDPGKDGATTTAGQAEAVVEAAVQLLLWRDLPKWQHPVSASIRDCLHSLAYLHNETVNIFSHIFGALLFFVLPIYIFNATIPPRYDLASAADILVVSLYFLGVAICFTLSVIFHTLSSHSPQIYTLGLHLDFQGVIILMWSANIPLIFYSFPCIPSLRYTYFALITILALACSAFTFSPRFRDPHLRPLRAVTFGSLALSTFVPVVHGILRYGYETQSERVGLRWVVATLGFNTLGAVAYAFKFPEKWYPRTFDMFGASHQIMHVAIVVAGVMYGLGVVAEFDYACGHRGECLAG
ncbi:hemolysin-III related-domain-containing protein [Echria macrotheca]|uniref:Hemolysin-III related-domain-containing protein n=1 Tax=Echria macrotheca TaxID=438768 RepID=A0AAJ0B7K4_9PEZI|nr:hemolysin-III related-domain-containing protein [Echria macrotheca]